MKIKYFNTHKVWGIVIWHTVNAQLNERYYMVMVKHWVLSFSSFQTFYSHMFDFGGEGNFLFVFEERQYRSWRVIINWCKDQKGCQSLKHSSIFSVKLGKITDLFGHYFTTLYGIFNTQPSCQRGSKYSL